MFTKLKTTILAAAAAAATLAGSGPAWALDVSPASPPVSSGNAIPGCSTATWEVIYADFTAVPGLGFQQKSVNMSWAGGGAQSIQVEMNADGSFRAMRAGDYGEIFPGFSTLNAACPNLTFVSYDVQTPETTDAAAFDAAGFAGLVFLATDSTDGVTYRYTTGFEGVTNSVGVFRREPLDTTSPSVTLSGGPASLTGTDPFTVTATFDEDVTGFDDLVNDVTITNGTVTAITGGPAVYTLEITPTGAGDVEITVPAAAAQDAASNPNTVSNTLVIGNRIVEITQEQIAGFMLGRANNLASNQPGLTRFLMGDGCGAFSANANEAAGSINGCVAEGNVWAEISSSWSGDGSYTLGTIGAHSFINPDLLIGGMVQFDYTDDPANNASGRGWMIGPYFVARVPEQPLYFEGRLLYGQTDNNITPIGTYTDSFETERWLAQLRATGEYQAQNTTLMPLLDFTYTEDSQRTYTDSLGNTIPGQTISLMQLNAGLDFSQPLPVQSGTLILTGGLSGIYSATDGGAAAPEFENWRGRTHLGLNYDTGTGATMNVGAFYDGIGTGYESYGARAGFDWRF